MRSSDGAPLGLVETLRAAVRFVAGSVLPREEREIILGDLEELHRSWKARDGSKRAAGRYLHWLVASVGVRSLERARTAFVGTGRAVRRWGNGGGPFWDAKRVLRALRRQPTFVVVATLTLGAGLGSAGAVFSVVNQLLLRPLPGVSEPNEGAYLEFISEDRRNVGVSGPVAQQIRESATLLDGIATFDYVGLHVSVGDDNATEARGYTIYGDYFEVLGVRPAAGRLLTPEETGPDADPFRVVISERLAQRLFGGAEEAVARQAELNGDSYTVLGVAGDDFVGTDRSWQIDVWVPRSAYVPLTGFSAERLWATDSSLNQDFILRAAAGVRLESAEAEINAILSGLAETGAIPGEQAGSGGPSARVHPGLNVTPVMRPLVRTALAVLSLAGVLILLIPCANVANLLVIRALNARGQMAVRRALGASRTRVVSHALAESFLLAVLGAVAGIGVAFLIGTTLQGHSLWGLPALEGFALDRRVWTFGLAALVITALLSGTLPAVVAARFDPAAALTDAGAQTTGRHRWIRHGISTVQIALSMTLLVGSVLLARTVMNVYAVDSGLDVSGVQVVSIKDWRREPITLGDLAILEDELVNSLVAIKGVREAALQSFYGPYNGFLPSRITTVDQTLDEARVVASHWVTPGWFEMFDVRPVAGRVLRPSDAERSGAPPIVLTAPLAQALFGTTNAVGRTVRRGIRDLEEAVVIGVVGELRMVDPTDPPDEAYFLPYPGGQAMPITVLVATEPGRPNVLVDVQAELERLLPDLSVPQPTPLAGRIDQQIGEQRLLARLLSIFSGIAVLLSGVGLYGVMAYAVQGRKRELGIRLALGANGSRLARLVFRSAGATTGVGIALGLIGAYALSRLVQSRLFGVTALDPATYVGGAALLALIALLAGWAPLRAAARIDVSETLRRD